MGDWLTLDRVGDTRHSLNMSRVVRTEEVYDETDNDLTEVKLIFESGEEFSIIAPTNVVKVFQWLAARVNT